MQVLPGSSQSPEKICLFLHSCSNYFTRSFRSIGFPGCSSDKELAYQFRRHKRCELDPCVRKIHWRRAWQHTPVLPGEWHGQRSLVGLQSMGRQRVRHNWGNLTLKIHLILATNFEDRKHHICFLQISEKSRRE